MEVTRALYGEALRNIRQTCTMTQDDVAAIKAHIQSKLVLLGEYDAISRQLKLQLYEAGWFDQITQAATKELEANTTNFEALYRALRPQGEQLVPELVREDILKRIRAFLVASIQ